MFTKMCLYLIFQVGVWDTQCLMMFFMMAEKYAKEQIFLCMTRTHMILGLLTLIMKISCAPNEALSCVQSSEIDVSIMEKIL